MKVFITFFIFTVGFFIFHQHASAQSVCEQMLSVEKKWNKSLPKKIDPASELTQVRVSCGNKTVIYAKRILVSLRKLAPGWEENQKRQHSQLHCNAKGLASYVGWTAIDVWSDLSYSYVLTIRTSPADCK